MNLKIILKITFCIFLVGVGFASDKSDPCDDPTPTPRPGPTPPNNNPPDPAFMNNDPKDATIKTKSTAARKVSEVEMRSDEQNEWLLLCKQLEKNAAESFKIAYSVWGQNKSVAFQRLVIIKARDLVDSSDQGMDLSYMLDCLDDAGAQRRQCLNLGRGNGLEKGLAAHRLAILEANPNLRLEIR